MLSVKVLIWAISSLECGTGEPFLCGLKARMTEYIKSIQYSIWNSYNGIHFYLLLFVAVFRWEHILSDHSRSILYEQLCVTSSPSNGIFYADKSSLKLFRNCCSWSFQSCETSYAIIKYLYFPIWFSEIIMFHQQENECIKNLRLHWH